MVLLMLSTGVNSDFMKTMLFILRPFISVFPFICHLSVNQYLIEIRMDRLIATEFVIVRQLSQYSVAKNFTTSISVINNLTPNDSFAKITRFYNLISKYKN